MSWSNKGISNNSSYRGIVFVWTCAIYALVENYYLKANGLWTLFLHIINGIIQRGMQDSLTALKQSPLPLT